MVPALPSKAIKRQLPWTKPDQGRRGRLLSTRQSFLACQPL